MRDTDLIQYYSKRVAEYERIYERPERQRDLATLQRRLGELVTGQRVLELACGTGYWTQVMAGAAASIHAIDAGLPSIEIARGKRLPADRVTFEVGDVFDLGDMSGRHSTVVAGFWWSHVARQSIDQFVHDLIRSVGPGTQMVFFDNRYVAGSSTPICRVDEHGNSYQLRRLSTGEQVEVLKNFPTPEELADRVRRYGDQVAVELLDYYWLLRFKVVEADPSRSGADTW